jgi:hypothetical protein
MKLMRALPLSTALVALSSMSFASGSAAQVATSQASAPSPPAASSAPQGPPKVCLDVRTDDHLTQAFANTLRQTIAASGTFSLAATTDSCSLRLHVPGNLLRFETAGGVMVSTVVIVTSSAGRYLSTSITACQATNLNPCAVRAVAAAKLALLVAGDGT